MSGTRTQSRTIVVAGDARAPAGSGVYEVFKHIGVVLEVDPETDTIVDVDSIFLTRLARQFLRRLLVGYRLSDGFRGIRDLICERVHFSSQGALLVALHMAFQRYWTYKTRTGRDGVALDAGGPLLTPEQISDSMPQRAVGGVKSRDGGGPERGAPRHPGA